MERFTRLRPRGKSGLGVESAASNRGIIRAFRTLSGEQREILRGILDLGKSMDLIAIELGMDEAEVAKRYKDALESLDKATSRQGSGRG